MGTCSRFSPNMVVSRNEMEETQFRLNSDDAVKIDSPSKRRKISSSSTDQLVHHPGDQVEVYTPQQDISKNHYYCSSIFDLTSEVGVMSDDFFTEDDLSWMDRTVGLSHKQFLDGGLATELLPTDGNFGKSEGLSMEDIDLSVSLSDQDLLGYIKSDEDSLMGEEYGVQEAGGRAALDTTANSNGCAFDPKLDKSFGFTSGIGKFCHSKNGGNSRNSPIVNMANNGKISISHGKSPVSDIYKTEIGRVGDGSSSLCSEALALDLRGEKNAPMDHVSDVKDIKPEYCPQAVIDWYNHESNRKKLKLVNGSGGTRKMSLKAKNHLVAVGWRLSYVVKQKQKLELRYTSPKGKCYISLVRACKGCMEDEGFSESMGPTEGMIACEKSKGLSSGEKFSSAITRTMADESLLPVSRQSEKGYTELHSLSKLKELECDNIHVKGIIGHEEKQKNMSIPLSSKLLQSQTSAQEGIDVPNLHNRGLRQSLDQNVNSQKKKKDKEFRSLNRVGYQLDGSHQISLSRSSKSARQVTVLSSMHQTPRTVLSWLIDSNVVLPMAKVYCMGRKATFRMTRGRVTPEGIICNCCNQVFSLAKFEAHADSTNRRPAASIFLEDGRSLLECQTQMVGHKLKGFTSEPHERIKRNNLPDKSDGICSVCHYGGKLLLCDQCPSSFHLSCLGLKDLPEGNWFCPSCRCGICEQSEFDGDTEKFTEKTGLYCDQCEREYHVGCIRQREAKLESCPKGNWFCSKNCEKIFAGLHELLGKSSPVGVNDLSWTILKALKDDYHDMDGFDIETMVEHHSKLNVALSVIHECFEPINQPGTKRDLVEDVLFNRRSELNRLNFRGFYTVLLEKDDELIAVATLRVHGKNMAEVPLIGTRVKYRRQGMCRILMNVIEKTLAVLGVERLILPSILQMLLPWTMSFGFSMMKNSDRLKFLEHTFLDFQETIMCQKILRTTTPTEKSRESRAQFAGNQCKLGDGSNPNDSNVDMDRYSVDSEVIQAERIEQSEVVDQNHIGA